MRNACAVVFCAFAASACEGSRFPSTPTPTPARPAGLVSVVTPAAVTASTFACGSGMIHSNVDLIVTAGRSTVFVDRVTLHLIDGTNVGSSATFGRADLEAEFGSTRIVIGTNRTFALQPRFACATLRPRALRADLTIIDDKGVPFALSATSTLP